MDGCAVSVESIVANKGLIKGFLSPIFYEEMSGRSGLGPVDFAKVRDGYACAQCLCEYTTYLVRCPVCGWERDLARDLEAPPELWVDNLREHDRIQREAEAERFDRHGNQVAGPAQAAPASFEELMRRVNADPDIDKVPIKKLGPSKWGRK